MRVHASINNGHLYRVYDYKIGAFRRDCVWADDELHQLGLWPYGMEQRRKVLIIPPLWWIGVDVPEEKTEDSILLVKETTYGSSIPFPAKKITVRSL